MSFPGFLGTRADGLTDVSIVLFTILPLLLAFGIRLARRRAHVAHRNVQLSLLALVLFLIAIFETNIRLAGGTDAFLAHSSVDHTFVRVFLLAHIAIAVATALLWIVIAVRSWPRFGDSLPGRFTRWHRRAGWTMFAGACLISSSGCALYVFLFVM